jgi:hypothetical protein
MDEYKVNAAIDLGIIKLDPLLRNTIMSISESSNKLVDIIEKSEKPIRICLYCLSFSFVVLASSVSYKIISDTYRNNNNFSNRNS